jgi:predicted Na+-dependent transporter
LLFRFRVPRSIPAVLVVETLLVCKVKVFDLLDFLLDVIDLVSRSYLFCVVASVASETCIAFLKWNSNWKSHSSILQFVAVIAVIVVVVVVGVVVADAVFKHN